MKRIFAILLILALPCLLGFGDVAWQSGESSTTITVYPAANDDDGYKRETTGDWFSDNGAGLLKIGASGGEQRSGHFRFEVNIPDNSTIISVYLTCTAGGNQADGSVFDIYAEDTNASAQINNVGEYNTAVGNLTAASVNWDLPATTTNTEYTSPDLATVVQEVIDDNAGVTTYLQLFLVSTASTDEVWIYDYENGSKYAELVVTYH